MNTFRKERINAYFAVLLITIVGAGAATLILHVALNNDFLTLQQGNEAKYAALQQSILKSQNIR